MAYSQFGPASQAGGFLLPQAPVRSSSRWLPLLGAGLGLVAVSAGVAGCSRPASTSEAAKPAYSEQQVSDAKKAVCADYEKGFRAIQTAVSKSPESSTEIFSSTLLNARIAEIGVANYLLNSLEENPAAPSELRDLVNQLANLYQKIAIIQLSDGSREETGPVADKTRDLTPKISQICQ